MDRNRWETAIRCLEVALHPGTGDDEVIAGVNGFRRTAAGTPLGEICAELAAEREACAASDRLGRENLALRRRLEREKASQLAALQRLHEAQRLIHELSDEIRAEQQSFADFRSASAQIVDGLQHQNIDLRGALDRASQAVNRPASPFRDILAAALGDAPPSRAPAAPSVAPPRHPWTA
jgi:hypothetical protein